MRRIYLDTAAGTPLDPRVRRAMGYFLNNGFGNPSSIHQEGVLARRAVEAARRTIAAALEAATDEIVFVSSGTEANNLAILGTARAAFQAGIKRPHLITTAIEHPSILEPGRKWESWGCPVTYLPVSGDGLVEPEKLAAALRPETVLVSIGYANSEIGTIQPIRELAKIIRRFKKVKSHRLKTDHYPYFHVDACQAVRFLEIRLPVLAVDLLTLDAGKIYGPGGMAALFVRRGIKLEPLVFGGGQEQGRRSGTENVAGIVGFGKAVAICVAEREKESKRLSALRDRFIKKLSHLPGVFLNGSLSARLPNNINVCFTGVEAEQVVLELDAKGIACSTGSACASGKASYVIMALGRSQADAQSSTRFSLDRRTTKQDLDYVLGVLPAIIKKLRKEI